MNPIRFTVLITLLALLAGSGGNLLGQGNAFTYQGLLRDSNGPVTTVVGIQFRLYATPSGGVAVWQETVSSIPVTNGLFAVALGQSTPADATIFNGSPRWLGISVNGGSELTPRQSITATPYAVTAGNVTSVVPSSGLAGTYSAPVAFNNPANNFTGSGTGLTALNASQLTAGTVADALLSANIALRNAPNTFMGDQAIIAGNAGINLTNPLHRLHVGTTRGTNAFNASANVIAIEHAVENGRATFLALAGIGGPDTTNRVEVQIEAAEGGRRGIIGTTSEHPVYLRVGNSDVMVLATNRFVGINETAPAARLHVTGSSAAPQLRLEQTVNNDFARLRFNSTTKPFWDVAVGGANNVMNFFNPANGNVMVLRTNGDLSLAGTLSAALAGGSVSSAEIADGTVSAADVNTPSFSTTFWKTDGNAGTTPGAHFLGTIDNQPLEIKVNNQRILRLEAPNPGFGPNVIAGETNNSIETYGSTIAGGSQNRIRDGSHHSYVGGGRQNTIDANSENASIAGGRLNSIQTNAIAATIGGGFDNEVRAFGAHATIAGGERNVVQRNAEYGTIPGGANARVNLYGQLAYASGSFGNSEGSAQTSLYVLRGVQTSTSGTIELFLNGANRRMVLSPGVTWTFDILIVARLSPTPESAGFQIRGVIENFAGTVSFIGTPVVTLLGTDQFLLPSASVEADLANSALAIKCRGAVSGASTINWVASVRTVEVSN